MDFIILKMLAFVLIMTRVCAALAICPIFSWKSIPKTVLVPMMVMISLFFGMKFELNIDPENVEVLQALLLISHEAIYGLSLGLISLVLFSVVRVAGKFIERQVGLRMGKMLNPLTDDTSAPIAMILEVVFILLILSVNGHHAFLIMLEKSYEAFPIGVCPSIELMYEGVIAASSTMFVLALRLSAPIMAAFILLLVILAVMAKMAPEMNILFLSLPIRVGLGLVLLTIFVPHVQTYFDEFMMWMNKLLPL